MNKQIYDKLPPDAKKVVDKLAGEYEEKFAKMWNQIDFGGKEFAVSKGVEIIELAPAEVEKWKAAAEPAINAYVQSMVGAGYKEDEVRGWIKYLRERIDYRTKQQIEMKIKSITGPPEVR